MSRSLEAHVEVLNDMLQLDPNATRALFGIRVLCKEGLADYCYPYSLDCQDNQHCIGVIGLLNVLLAQKDRRLTYVHDNNLIVGFEVVDTLPSEETTKEQ